MVLFKCCRAIRNELVSIKHELRQISATCTAIHAALKAGNDTLSFNPNVKVYSFCGTEGDTNDVVKENIKVAIMEHISGIVQSDIPQE